MEKFAWFMVFGSVVMLAGGCKPIEHRQSTGSEVKTNEVETFASPIGSCPNLYKAPMGPAGFTTSFEPPKSWSDLAPKVKQNISYNAKIGLQLLVNPYNTLVRKHPLMDFKHRLGMLLIHKGGLRNLTRVYIGGRDQKDVDGVIGFVKNHQISCEDVVDEKRRLQFDIVGIQMNFPKSKEESYRKIHFHGQNTDWIVMELLDSGMMIRVASGRWASPVGLLDITAAGASYLLFKKAEKRVHRYDTYFIDADGGITEHNRVTDYKKEDSEHTVLLREGALVEG